MPGGRSDRPDHDLRSDTDTEPATRLNVVGDKWQHFLAFGGMAGLARLGFRKVPNWVILETTSFIGALIEVFQAIPELHRDCDWKDWVVDSAGAFCAILFVHLCGPYLFKYPYKA
jgi:hypothetical protein